MKPLNNCALSVWKYILLFILFCLPYVGFVALIICAFCVKNPEVSNFAKAMFWLTVIAVVAIIVLYVVVVIYVMNYGYTESDPSFDFGNSINDGIEAFLGIKNALNIA